MTSSVSESFPTRSWRPSHLDVLTAEQLSWRYVDDASDEFRARVVALSSELAAPTQAHLPHSEVDPVQFLDFLLGLSPAESVAASQIFESGLVASLPGIVSIRRGLPTDSLLNRLKVLASTSVIYESMPTEVYAEVKGGFSAAVIKISEGDPEVVEGLHVHNGGRWVLALSEHSKLGLPGLEVPLGRGDLVYMPPFSLHNFHEGDFFAVHTSEAGFQHPDAFVKFSEDQ